MKVGCVTIDLYHKPHWHCHCNCVFVVVVVLLFLFFSVLCAHLHFLPSHAWFCSYFKSPINPPQLCWQFYVACRSWLLLFFFSLSICSLSVCIRFIWVLHVPIELVNVNWANNINFDLRLNSLWFGPYYCKLNKSQFCKCRAHRKRSAIGKCFVWINVFACGSVRTIYVCVCLLWVFRKCSMHFAPAKRTSNNFHALQMPI